ncbi:MAG: glutaminyl-peptide cyclotransferase [Myxococcota bacterium]|jgi:glutaminyl-peptide cyclotransferase
MMSLIMTAIHRNLSLSALFGATLLSCAVNTSCGNENTLTPIDPASISFDEQRAFADLQYLCDEIGTRRIGTKGSKKTQEWLVSTLTDINGWTASTDEFIAVPPRGARRQAEITGANVFARRAGSIPGEIWICSHYDTFDKPGFVGANDGGSSTVVLIEFARQLQGDTPLPGMSIVLCWFDGEEAFPPVAWNDNVNSTFGSRYVAQTKKDDGTLSDIKAFVLLDMVGDKSLGLVKDTTSHTGLKKIFERTAQQLDDSNIFVGEKKVSDDHIHFRKLGVPTIDIIDFNFGPANSYWHTTQDVIENTSAESLGRVGRLVLAALPTINAEYGVSE